MASNSNTQLGTTGEDCVFHQRRTGQLTSVRKAFRAVLECGTAALGWEVYASDTEEKRCYHTCKSRFCPSCGYRATLLWLEEQEAALPDIPYTGVVFTMPRELWPVFKRNRHLLHDLPALAAGVIRQWISRKYGARALIMVVPHTFGGDLKFNSHIHLLVSAGGFEESDGHWIPRLSLNKDALMKMWRFAVISHLRLALKSGVLESNLNIRDMRSLLSNAYKSERHPRWIIFLENRGCLDGAAGSLCDGSQTGRPRAGRQVPGVHCRARSRLARLSCCH
jgi:Transposase zinc-binding domain/Putative transposase